MDWLLPALYLTLVLFGWINIHAVSYDQSVDQSLFDLSRSAGRQFIWILSSGVLFLAVLLIDSRTYQAFAYMFYAFSLFLLLLTFVWGVGVGGHQAWLQWGGQPSEFAKLTTALAIARYLDNPHTRLSRFESIIALTILILLPVGTILLQGDLGSALVFAAFIIVLYREGFPAWAILIGVAVVVTSIFTLLFPRVYLLPALLSLTLLAIIRARRSLKKILLIMFTAAITLAVTEGLHFFVEQVLKPHQQNRIKALIDPAIDPLGIGWNVTQSKIAIGSGGLWGKGFLQGTQTKYGFVPEQTTDFIFCTIGEEYGWVGSAILIGLFMGLIARILYLAERQHLRFARVYGYAVASILFFHFMVNIGMTIGMMPVIGIPLPFISYGGSSLWSFSLMLFILLKLDTERKSHIPCEQAPSLH